MGADGEKSGERRLELWQVILAVVGIVISVVFGVLQLQPQILNPPPQAPPANVNLTGIVLEPQETAEREGRIGRTRIMVVQAPSRGRWRGLICQGDEIETIDGFGVDLESARRTLYADNGALVRVRAQPTEPGREGRVIPLEPDGLARC